MLPLLFVATSSCNGPDSRTLLSDVSPNSSSEGKTAPGSGASRSHLKFWKFRKFLLDHYFRLLSQDPSPQVTEQPPHSDHSPPENGDIVKISALYKFTIWTNGKLAKSNFPIATCTTKASRLTFPGSLKNFNTWKKNFLHTICWPWPQLALQTLNFVNNLQQKLRFIYPYDQELHLLQVLKKLFF